MLVNLKCAKVSKKSRWRPILMKLGSIYIEDEITWAIQQRSQKLSRTKFTLLEPIRSKFAPNPDYSSKGEPGANTHKIKKNKKK